MTLKAMRLVNFWLVIGSAFGLLASLKLHLPDLLTEQAFFTFGRARTVHLNLVAYGWLSMTGIAVAMWVAPRIFHTPLRFARLPVVGAILWNIGVASGAVAIANGWTDGEEWLEIPWQIDILLAVAGAFFVVPLLATAARRDVEALVHDITKIETAIEPRFQEHFVAANAIPHATDPFTGLRAVVPLPEPSFNAGPGGSTGRRRRR